MPVRKIYRNDNDGLTVKDTLLWIDLCLSYIQKECDQHNLEGTASLIRSAQERLAEEAKTLTLN